VAADLTSRFEGENSILFGGNGRSVAGGRLKAPALKGCKASGVDFGTEALQHDLAGDFSAFINRDFYDLIPGRLGQLPGVDDGIRSRDRKSRAYFVAKERPTVQSSVGHPGLCAMTQSRKRLSVGGIFGVSAGKRMRWRQFCKLGGCFPSQFFMTKPLLPVALGRGIRGTMGAVVRRTTAPIKAGDLCSVSAQCDRDRIEQAWLGRMQQPSEQASMQGKRPQAYHVLPACGLGIQLSKHQVIPDRQSLLSVS